MINKPPPLQGLDIRIPIIIPSKGRGSINQGFGLWGSVHLPHLGQLSLCSFDFGLALPRFVAPPGPSVYLGYTQDKKR